jgi:glutathione synthase/RimK-type ligase-like ATP-grasp enzyme
VTPATRPHRVALATSAAVPDLAPDDRLLLPALAARAIQAEPAVWDDPELAWERYDAVVVRSCWDYHHKPDRFDRWTRRIEAAGVPLWNPPALLRWNARKTYLRELAGDGVPVVPTRFLESGAGPELDAVLREAGWREAVVKPVVSASAHETWRAERGRPADGERFRELVGRMPVMVQPFLPEIEREGEWSFCFFGGEYSHAVLKRPRPGDFRVQSDHGGVYHPAEPPDELIEQARAALRAARSPTLYARVDGCLIEGELLLMELELLEPGLFLAMHPRAPERFADALASALASG